MVLQFGVVATIIKVYFCANRYLEIDDALLRLL